MIYRVSKKILSRNFRFANPYKNSGPLFDQNILMSSYDLQGVQKKYFLETLASQIHKKIPDHFGPFSTMSDHFGHFGLFMILWTILDHLDHFGPLWTILDPMVRRIKWFKTLWGVQNDLTLVKNSKVGGGRSSQLWFIVLDDLWPKKICRPEMILWSLVLHSSYMILYNMQSKYISLSSLHWIHNEKSNKKNLLASEMKGKVEKWSRSINAFSCWLLS